MNGLDLCKKYFETYGEPMLSEQFGAYKNRIAAGLVGEGSECLGYDDEFSRDHDFGPAFCLFLTKEDYAAFGFALERAYAKLPREFEGVKRPLLSSGAGRHGVFAIGDFYARFLGSPTAPRDTEQWLSLPPAALLSASNGAVFTDPLGEFSAVREVLRRGYPEDVRRKKLAGALLLASQAGEYNFPRALARGDLPAAQLAVTEFVKHAVSACFLLFNRYEPFYKWAFRALLDLPLDAALPKALSALLLLGSAPEDLARKQELVAEIAKLLSAALREQSLSAKAAAFLDAHAIAVNDSVRDPHIRNLHILAGV